MSNIEQATAVKSRGRATPNPNRVQIWFRAPRIWNEFLEAKAAEEYCTRSDLLRHAFKIAYGSELKEFRVNTNPKPGEGGDNFSLDGLDDMTGTDAILALVSRELQTDPWMESVAAFVANKGSSQTRRVYRLVLHQFFVFAAKHPSDIKQSDVIRYRHQLTSLHRAPSTIRQHLATVSGYYSFCVSRDLTVYNPVKGVARPSVHAYISASWLTKDQAKKLLSQPDRGTVKGKRDYAILLTLFLTGLRRSELTNIKRGDIREKGDKLYLTYICKGGAQLVRDIPRRCWEVIDDYLISSGREITDESPIFVAVTDAGERLRSYYGKNGHSRCHPISPEAVRQMVTRYSKIAFGGEIKVSPHTLRHTAGTLLRKSGHSIEEVQSFLKHRRIDTTRRYLHVVEADDSEFGESIAKMLDL